MVDYKTENAGEKLKGWADVVVDTTKEVEMGKLILKESGGDLRTIADFSSPEYSVFCKANRELIEIIAKLLEEGKVKPVIDQVFPFEESFQAIEYQMSGRAKGKIIIDISE